MNPTRRTARLLGAVTAATSLAAASLFPSSAEALPAPRPTTPAERCALGTDPDAQTTLHLAGGRGATLPATGSLRAGDFVDIAPRLTDQVSTTGWWWQPAEGWNWVTPRGVQPRAAAPAGWPAPGLSQHALIGRFNSFQPFEVVPRGRCFQIGSDGPFDLRVNDPQDWDNFGAWNVDVRVYHTPILDGSFENQRSTTISAPWFTEGSVPKAVTTDSSLGHGSRQVILSNGGSGWNAVLQTVPVRPNTDYELVGFVKASSRINTGFFGARLPGVWPPKEIQFGATSPTGLTRISKTFNSENSTSVTVFAGFWGVGTAEHLVVDDLILLSR